ncbi:DUF6891 domain-containing protein [Parenemella sanctibonifatiensis]|uniref:DUF6891 domain-containing protein n=1 Tax=Parenemella sanctibonifatiensis TaxID=2016505 RepID=UPI0038995197
MWNDLAATCEAWADETTDVDRLDATFEELPEHGIAAVQFADWASLDPEDGDIGGVMTADQAIDRLELGEIELAIYFTSFEDGREAEVARTVVDTLKNNGLNASWDGSVDSAIMVPLLWRPHIEPLEG